MINVVLTPNYRVLKTRAFLLLAVATLATFWGIHAGGEGGFFVGAGACVCLALIQVSAVWHKVEVDDEQISQKLALRCKRTIRWADVQLAYVGPKAVMVASDERQIKIARHQLPGGLDVLGALVFLAVNEHAPNAFIAGYPPQALIYCWNCKNQLHEAATPHCPKCGQEVDPRAWQLLLGLKDSSA